MIERARRIVLLAVLCACAFSVPFAVTSWLERSPGETTVAPAAAPPVAPAAAPPVAPSVTYYVPSAIELPEAPVSVELNTFELIPARDESVHRSYVLIDEVRDVLRNSFYRPVAAAVLDKPSVGQIIEGLGDPYAEYLSPSDFNGVQDAAATTYEGVGLLVGHADSGLIVTSALRGPARDAGIRPGDVIISIDGVLVEELAFERAISLFHGERGTIVTLMISRPGEDRQRVARVVRQEIDTPAVRVRILNTEERNLGYIRLLSFPVDAGEQVRNATSELIQQGVEGIVLDLRGNPGGHLSAAVEVASVFLRTGIVCTTDGLHRPQTSYTPSGAAIAGELPIVTLVDGQSASAAEIVAAAMRENNRGQVVGASTFGKASVQSVVPLSNGGGLRLTTATYLTPRGHLLAGEGVLPHVEALDDPLTRRDEGLRKARATLAKLVERADELPLIHF